MQVGKCILKMLPVRDCSLGSALASAIQASSSRAIGDSPVGDAVADCTGADDGVPLGVDCTGDVDGTPLGVDCTGDVDGTPLGDACTGDVDGTPLGVEASGDDEGTLLGVDCAGAPLGVVEGEALVPSIRREVGWSIA